MDNHVEEVVDRRQDVYGDPTSNMIRTAQMWSGFLDHEIQPWQVPVMMALFKLQRVGIAPDYSDNIDDVDGYLSMFRRVIGDDMVVARSVAEYLEKKDARLKDEPDLEAVMRRAGFSPEKGVLQDGLDRE